jgi:GntR family transcriptional regulator
LASVPKHQEIADELRGAIADGSYPPGTTIPREVDLASQYRVDRSTVRRAVATLRAEGLVIPVKRRGTVVRDRSVSRRLGSDRYQREINQIGRAREPETSFTADRGITWSDYQLDKRFEELPAAEAVANLLGVPAGTPVLARRFVFLAAGVPEQMSTSYLPLSVVAGTPVADPANEPWPGGNIAQLATLGHIVSRVQESVQARMPTRDEAETLHIPAGAPVFAITRVMFTGPNRDRPIEVAADIVIPADRTVLEYVIDLEPPT